jgi:hypothetical protein
MKPTCVPLLLGHYYKVISDGKHYPNVYTKVLDEDGSVVYYSGLPVHSIWPKVDASCVLAGRTVAIEIDNLGSVHTEKALKDGWIVPAYNEKKKRFEIQYRASLYTSQYSVIAHT